MASHNVLLLGSGGRECALAHKLSQSGHCGRLFIAPGNGGTAAYGTNVSISILDFEAIKRFCLENNISILLPGGEDALVAGIYDFFKGDAELDHIIVAGPSKAGAQLEGSKAFSKKFMQRHNIPTAAYREFDKSHFEDGVAYLLQHALPVVIKADGLAAGKGVIIAQTADEAIEAFTAIVRNGQFGAAGNKVVIEEFLTGIELSVFAFTDAAGYVLLPEAKDYKRIGEGDTGLNTGGMGAISPVPFADDAFMQKVKARIVEPTISGLAAEGLVYNGFVFFGLISVGGEPYVIEYNCRMGDPETEVVMPRLETDLIELILAMDEGRLGDMTIAHSAQAAATVMLVAEGYPEAYEKGKAITGIGKVSGSTVYHAGTIDKEGVLLSNGGRVLAITSLASTLEEALYHSYQNVVVVEFEGKHYRGDIGWEFLDGQKASRLMAQ
jgi:phosphoribosylamine--glycine ligase